MDEKRIKDVLQPFYTKEGELGITVYVQLKSKDDLGVKKLDIEGESLPSLLTMFLEYLRDIILDNDDIRLMKLSSSDERKDAIYVYDIEVPHELTVIDSVLEKDNHPLFDFNNENLSQIKALLIEIGNNDRQIVLYKTMAPVNVFSRSHYFLKTLPSDHRFEKINEDFLRISPNFQLAKIGGSLLVMDLANIEKSFGFHEVIKKEAKAGIEAIEEMSIINNIETLKELAEEVKYARKLTRIATSSPVIKAKVSNPDIIAFCKTFPELKGRIRFSQDESQIVLDTKVSKDLFIQLLMDEFLTSELTKFHYRSLAKDEADEANEIEQEAQ